MKSAQKGFFFVLCVFALFSVFSLDYTARVNQGISQIQPLEEVEFIPYAQEIDMDLTFISADNSSFEYSGRIDFANPSEPVLIWQGSQIRFNFSGKHLAIRMKNSSSRFWYDVIIDGKIYALNLANSYEVDYLLDTELEDTTHECIIFKRNEGMYSKDTFLGVMIDSKGASKTATGLLGDKPEQKKLKIEFYGDSITVGACNECIGDDSYEDYYEHNNYTSYGAITARNLDAEYSNLAISGTGVCVSWNDLILPDMWKRLYPYGKDYDFSTRDPDIVVVNLGQNDYGYPASKGESFPKDFTQRYKAFLSEIIAQYPNAMIISATGGMSAVRSSRALISSLNKAIKELNDPNIKQMIFKNMTDNHPRVDTHIKMAQELTDFIQKNLN